MCTSDAKEICQNRRYHHENASNVIRARYSQKSSVFFDLFLRKPRAEKSHDVIFFENLRFQNIFRPRKVDFFKVLRTEEHFQKALFS